MHKMRDLNIMKIISLLLVIVFCTLSTATFASVTSRTSSVVTYTEAPALSLEEDGGGGGGDTDGLNAFIKWILDTLLSFIIGVFSPCQEVPDFTSFKSGTKSLILHQINGFLLVHGLLLAKQ